MCSTRIPMSRGIYSFYSLNDVEIGENINMEDFEEHLFQVEIQNLLSDRGSTCLTYEGRILSTNRRVIIKEFYPAAGEEDIWPITRNVVNQKLDIPSSIWRTDIDGKIESRFRQFKRSYHWQRQFYSDIKFLETVAEPQYFAKYGDTYYVISDFHNGSSLNKVLGTMKYLPDKIVLMHYLTELMLALEKNGYMFLDICSDNFLVIEQTPQHYQLRLFDLDSIIDFRKKKEMKDFYGKIYFHKEYASDEICTLQQRLKTESFEILKSEVFDHSNIVYSLGVLFFEILFGYVPKAEERNLDIRKEALKNRLQESYKISFDNAEVLIGLLSNMLQPMSDKLYTGFDTCQTVLDGLNHFMEEMNYDSYLKKEKMLDVNANLVAYNMLQEYPLFYYDSVSASGKRCIKVVLAGKYKLRAGMLSAIISIGQMLDTRLDIAIVAEDARLFWDEYTDANHNPGLLDAVVVDFNDQLISGEWNERITDSPLAYIHLIETTSVEEDLLLYERGYRYFVLLEDTESKILRHYGLLRKRVQQEKPICIACVKVGRELAALESRDIDNIDIHFISASSVGMSYNEEMFRQRIYRMGLKVHAYYKGAMALDWDDDMSEMEQEYRSDLYSRMSSERAALHSIYKLASIGIDIKRPNVVRKYLHVLKNPERIEQLGHLEHRSWNAYMLSSGNGSIDVSKMDEYAYKGDNNWKERRDPLHVKTPLIASSQPVRKLPKDSWDNLSKKEVEALDDLDRVSYGIYSWYLSQKDTLKSEIERIFQDSSVLSASWYDKEQYEKLKEICEQCVEDMCKEESCSWNLYKIQKNKVLQKKTADYRQRERRNQFFKSLDRMIGMVQDSCSPRDYKQLDRDLVEASLEFILV